MARHEPSNASRPQPRLAMPVSMMPAGQAKLWPTPALPLLYRPHTHVSAIIQGRRGTMGCSAKHQAGLQVHMEGEFGKEVGQGGNWCTNDGLVPMPAANPALNMHSGAAAMWPTRPT